MINKITNFAKSDEYRLKIHDLIPGGAHTYSKGDDQFPARSPAAIDFGKGAYVWDLDGNKYLDCSMGLTSVVLGHAYEPVVEAVRKEIERGVNFQRPSILERQMAEEFLSLVPCHDMIKFSKNGSTATTAAVKLARAFTQRSLVAFPGDHAFYSYDDWFIGKTACNTGIPDPFKELTVTYTSADLGSLENLFDRHPGQIACVISEPERTNNQPEDYLQKLIDICHAHGALFIQDEMVSGFKTDFPGAIKKYNVKPDLATWGKAIANGFSFCALTGRKEIMELGGIRNEGADRLFLISTTHGGETHALAAGIATIREFKNKPVIKHNHDVGDCFIKTVRKTLVEKGLSDYISVSDKPWMQTFIVRNKQGEPDNGMRTLLLQEMIARGVLFQGAFVPSFSHSLEDIEYFGQALAESADIFSQALERGWEKFLVGPAIKPVFRKKN